VGGLQETGKSREIRRGDLVFRLAATGRIPERMIDRIAADAQQACCPD
jgi:hypothetical protein